MVDFNFFNICIHDIWWLTHKRPESKRCATLSRCGMWDLLLRVVIPSVKKCKRKRYVSEYGWIMWFITKKRKVSVLLSHELIFLFGPLRTYFNIRACFNNIETTQSSLSFTNTSKVSLYKTFSSILSITKHYSSFTNISFYNVASSMTMMSR